MSDAHDIGRRLTAADWPRIAEWLRVCPECRRVFCLAEPEAAAEWHYGHDCEVES